MNEKQTASPEWWLDNAQQLADENPYTFYRPSQQLLKLLQVGDLVKLIFCFEPDDPTTPSGERMWVEVTERNGDDWQGLLKNEPLHIPNLYFDDRIVFRTEHICTASVDDPVPSITDEYRRRCFVTNNILYEGEPVGYLYREAPDEEDDSGWRFTTGKETDEYMDDVNNSSYVSLGAVLARDDGFVHLLSTPNDCAFVRNEDGSYTRLAND